MTAVRFSSHPGDLALSATLRRSPSMPPFTGAGAPATLAPSPRGRREGTRGGR